MFYRRGQIDRRSNTDPFFSIVVAADWDRNNAFNQDGRLIDSQTQRII